MCHAIPPRQPETVRAGVTNPASEARAPRTQRRRRGGRPRAAARKRRGRPRRKRQSRSSPRAGRRRDRTRPSVRPRPDAKAIGNTPQAIDRPVAPQLDGATRVNATVSALATAFRWMPLRSNAEQAARTPHKENSRRRWPVSRSSAVRRGRSSRPIGRPVWQRHRGDRLREKRRSCHRGHEGGVVTDVGKLLFHSSSPVSAR